VEGEGAKQKSAARLATVWERGGGRDATQVTPHTHTGTGGRGCPGPAAPCAAMALRRARRRRWGALARGAAQCEWGAREAAAMGGGPAPVRGGGGVAGVTGGGERAAFADRPVAAGADAGFAAGSNPCTGAGGARCESAQQRRRHGGFAVGAAVMSARGCCEAPSGRWRPLVKYPFDHWSNTHLTAGQGRCEDPSGRWRWGVACLGRWAMPRPPISEIIIICVFSSWKNIV
jgi:hypothetical protein